MHPPTNSETGFGVYFGRSIIFLWVSKKHNAYTISVTILRMHENVLENRNSDAILEDTLISYGFQKITMLAQFQSLQIFMFSRIATKLKPSVKK